MKSFFIYMLVVLGAVSLLTALAIQHGGSAESSLIMEEQICSDHPDLKACKKYAARDFVRHCTELAHTPISDLSASDLADMRACSR